MIFEKKHANEHHQDSFWHSHPKISYLGLYSLVYVLLCLLIFSANILRGKLLVWQTDAVPQYIPYLQYLGDYIRDFLSNLFHGNAIPKLYDFHIGMGSDIRTVFRTHPLELLSVLVPGKYTEVLYNFLMFFRFYLAGLTFTAYCRYRNKSRRNAFIASFIYIFSGFTLRFGTRHPIFSIPLILLPVLLIALDKLIQKKSCLLFSGMVCLSLFCNYYYLYMNTIAMGVYALIRFPQCHKEKRISEFFRMMGRIIFFYLLGCGMAAISFFPTVADLFSSNRVASSSSRTFDLSGMLFYNINRIFNVFITSVSCLKTAGYTTYLGYAATALPALAALFAKRKKEYTGLKIALVIEFIALLSPLSGFIMSGFSALNNRWTYIIAFTVAFAVACVLDDFINLTRTQCGSIIAVTILYGAAFLYSCPKTREIKLTFLFLCITTISLLWAAKSEKIERRKIYTVFSFFTALSLVMHGLYLYGNFTNPYSSEFSDNGYATENIYASPFTRFSDSDQEEFCRIDSNQIRSTTENLPISLRYNGVSLYNSVISSPVITYHCDLSNIGISAVHRIWSLDGRTGMEALACVKYFMVEAENESYVPYGFSKDESLSDDQYQVYKNDHLLPIGYTYDSYIDASEYESMTALERQQCMLEGVVLENYSDDMNLTRLSSDDNFGVLTVTPESITLDEGVTCSDNICRVKNINTGIAISYEKKAGYEAYLHLGDFTREIYLNSIKIYNSSVTKSLILRGLNQDYSLGRSDYVVNLGYSATDSTDTVKIDFPKSNADYHLGQLEICYVPVMNYEEQIDALSKQGLTNVSITDNTVSGSAVLSKDGFMAFSIPYSSGWKAYVDGQETEIYPANTMYMGIALEKGEHGIVLKYTTPGLISGTIISLSCTLLFLLLYFLSKRKQRLASQ
ncbi:MAG: YfhO family protein [Eubacteriales bacterium]|nr:YfhO family protein [Eubacteriales bacterium]